MYGRDTLEIIGWVRNGAIYCPDHGPTAEQDSDDGSDWSAVFLDGSATDSPDHCGERDCDRLIRSDLTDDGYRYVLTALDKHVSRIDQTADPVLAAWWDEWGGDILRGLQDGALDLDPFGQPWLTRTMRGYVQCALWSETDDNGEPLDRRYRPQDIDRDGSAEMTADCVNFAAGNVADLRGLDAEQTGHNLWLTRNGHGTGFWDRGLDERGDRLTKSAKDLGPSSVYVGDDGELHVT
jgi:hypothetical protein